MPPPECSPTSLGTCGTAQDPRRTPLTLTSLGQPWCTTQHCTPPPLIPLTSLGEPCRTTQHCAYNGRRDRNAPSMRSSRSETGVPRDGSTDRAREGSMA